jgi:hypothetical protein
MPVIHDPALSVTVSAEVPGIGNRDIPDEITETHYIRLHATGAPRSAGMSIIAAVLEGRASEAGPYPAGEFVPVRTRNLIVDMALLASLPGGGVLIDALTSALTDIFKAQGDLPADSTYVRDSS